MVTLHKPTQRQVKNALWKLAHANVGTEAFATYLRNGDVVVTTELEMEAYMVYNVAR
jgi:hypothetical protein